MEGRRAQILLVGRNLKIDDLLAFLPAARCSINERSRLTARIWINLPVFGDRLAAEKNEALCGDVCGSQQTIGDLDANGHILQTSSQSCVEDDQREFDKPKNGSVQGPAYDLDLRAHLAVVILSRA